jgi:hypothetical protein
VNLFSCKIFCAVHKNIFVFESYLCIKDYLLIIILVIIYVCMNQFIKGSNLVKIIIIIMLIIKLCCRICCVGLVLIFSSLTALTIILSFSFSLC